MLKFIITVRSNYYTWRLVDAKGFYIAQPAGKLGWGDKKSCLDDIKLVKTAIHAAIQDDTPATLPPSPPYVPDYLDRNG